MRTTLLLALLASPACAQVMDGDAFEAFVANQSFAITDPKGARAYGTEHYFPGRRVTWRWLETGECEEGTWYESDQFAGGPALCFQYVDEPLLQCWRYERKGEGMRATFLGQPEAPQNLAGYAIAPDPGASFCEYLGS